MATLSQSELIKIDELKMSDRLKAMRERYFGSPIYITADRSHLATLSWRATDNDHMYIRHAKKFARICEGIPIAIHEHDLIVGSQSQYVRGTGFQIEWGTDGGKAILQGDRRGRGEGDHGLVSDEDLKIIEEDVAFWDPISPEKKVFGALGPIGEEMDLLIETGLLKNQDRSRVLWGCSPDFEKIMKIGLKGLLAEIEEELRNLDPTTDGAGEKMMFLQAGKITIDGMIHYARRHSELAKKLAQTEKDPGRKAELETIAEVCQWVPENPPRTFWEAVQSGRFILLGANLERGTREELSGRMDQYVYPLYEQDRQSGKLTLEHALDILGSYWMKVVEMETCQGRASMGVSEGHYGVKMMIGGVDRAGKDASNELGYLLFHLTGLMKTTEPAVYFRWHPDCPKEFTMKAVWAAVENGGGSPAFHNDLHTIPMLMKVGASLEDARDWVVWGCSHAFPYGIAAGRSLPAQNGAKMLELVMTNGTDPLTKKYLGIQTGDPRTFKSIEEWVVAWEKQWEYHTRRIVDFANMEAQLAAEHYVRPFQSVLHPDCIKKGKDIDRGGMRYPQHYLQMKNRVFADVADSLIAIKKFVYDEKKLTIDEVLDACADNFKGEKNEKIRDMLMSAPKYGNDLAEPDAMYRRLNVFSSDLCKKLKNRFGYPIRNSRNAASFHLSFGKKTGALPNGKKSRMPLANGSISAVAGAETRGPTASLRSAGNCVNWEDEVGGVLNQKLPKSLLRTKEHYEKFWAMNEAYFREFNSYQVQWNIQDAEVYRKAKANPEQYKDLVVRVGGYSAYFVAIDPVLQDEIIARSEQYL